MKQLTLSQLIREAKDFCEKESQENHSALMGITDGKAVGTYIEHKFQEYLAKKYEVSVGNSARGIDLPDPEIATDIKVTSVVQPQSSCPFESAQQKIFGLGYNLLVFVYEKQDAESSCRLYFKSCTFIGKSRTADFTTTKRLREMLKDGANKEDIIAYLQDRNVPGDEVVLNALADKILECTPEQGYLTISNALQWRLQYSRVIGLANQVEGIVNHEWK